MDESLAYFKILGTTIYIPETMTLLAFACAALGEETRASALVKEAYALSKAMESREDIALTLYGRGSLALAGHDVAKARSLLEESANILLAVKMKSVRLKWVLSSVLEELGIIAFVQDR